MSKLFYAMESYAAMNDTSVEVDVEVGEPEEVVEEQEEQVEAASEIAEDDAEAEAEEAQVEMVLHEFDKAETYLSHAKKFGVDRTFLALLDSDRSLSEAIGYSLPSCESFDAVGSTYSAETQAVIAGLEGILQDFWEWVKKVARKIADFFAGIFQWVSVRFGNTDKQIGKLRERLKNMVVRPSERMSNGNVTIPKKVSKSLAQLLKDAGENLKHYAWQIGNNLKDMGTPAQLKEDKAKAMNDPEKRKKFDEAVKKYKDDVETVSIKDGVNKVKDWLDEAAEGREAILKFNGECKTINTYMKEFEKVAIGMARHDGDSDTAKNAKKKAKEIASEASKAQSQAAKAVNVCSWSVGKYLKAASAVISGGYQNKNL